MDKNTVRTNLLNGVLLFPESFSKYVNLSEDKQLLIEELFQHSWINFLYDKDTSVIEHLESFEDEDLFNKCLRVLCKTGWMTSSIDNNYAKVTIRDIQLLKYVTAEELLTVKKNAKIQHYRLKYKAPFANDLVKIGNAYRKTGLIRNGFKLAASYHFFYDGDMIAKYKKYIAYNLCHEEKSLKEITYTDCIDEILDDYVEHQSAMNLNQCIIDSRGRSIFQCTKKIFNPVSSVDARACIECPTAPLTKEGWRNVWAFIAELNGYKALSKDIEDKIEKGKEFYEKKVFPSLDDIESYSNTHKCIWLERIYNRIQNYEGWWDIPIELDATASVVQFLAILTNNHEYMDLTNLINDSEFKDMWTVDYCSRNHVKFAITPRLYGSNAEPTELWAKHKLEYTTEQVNAILQDLRFGRFKAANDFKNFIIFNVQPSEKIHVKIWNEEFDIYCNKVKADFIKTQEYWIYTSLQDKVKRCTRNVEYIPDLEQFHRYFQTLLIHNLDSQVCNRICTELSWVLPNHDAFTIHPNNGDKCRKIYTNTLKEIYDNRHKILSDYCKSIGIVDKMWHDEDEGEIEAFSKYCLK